MAKSIRFNLNCDGTSIRTLEDLREHFCVQDVLGYYESGILARWLKIQGYGNEYDQLVNIKSNSNEDLLIEITRILGIEIDDSSIRDAVAVLEFEKKNREQLRQYENDEQHETQCVEDYFCHYKDLINQIIKNKNDFSAIKAITAILVKKYKKVLEFDFQNLFYKVYQKAPLALLSFVATKELRGYYIPEWVASDDGKENWDIEEKHVEDPFRAHFLNVKQDMYDKLCDLVASEKEMRALLGDKLKCNSLNTSGQWSEIEPDKKKKYLIFSMQQGCKVRSLTNKDEIYTSNDINRLFVVLNGIEYANGYNYKLFYMEV